KNALLGGSSGTGWSRSASGSCSAVSIRRPVSQLLCSTRRSVRSTACLLDSSPGTSSPPGGWKWMPFGAGSRKSPPCSLGAVPQLVCSALQQEPPPERTRRLSERRTDEPVEVEATEEATSRELLAACPVIDAGDDHVDERPQSIARHTGIMRRVGWTRLIAF